jgi:hypothetical protein
VPPRPAGPPAPPRLTVEQLTPVVERALGLPAVPSEWSLAPLRRSSGVATSGLYLVTGIAHDSCGASSPRGGSPALRWSAVLKILRPPPDGARHAAGARDPSHFAYWKREPDLYRSGLLAALHPGGAAHSRAATSNPGHTPGTLIAPRCLGVDTPRPDEAWLWLEHISGADPDTWPRDRYLLAARHLGAFGGRFLSPGGSLQLPDHPWLGRAYFRQRFELAESEGGWTRFADPTTWSHRLIAGAGFPPDAGHRLLELWSRRHALLDALDSLPQTLRHGDAHPHNLIARHPADAPTKPALPGPGDASNLTVAIDWGSAGVGAIGMDLLDLAHGALPRLAARADDAVALAGDLFTHYAAGLRDTAPDASPHDARRGYITGAALAIASRLHWLLPRLLDQPQEDAAGQLRRAARTTHAALALADEALAVR